MTKDLPRALLSVDTCGERGSVALVRDEQVVAEITLPERAASAGLLGAVRQVLQEAQVQVADLAGIGVVSGPGSFTGLRVGLAVCKGLCEATGIPLATVSRLRVLADAAGLHTGFAVLRAGRDQVYVREVRAGVSDGERLMAVPVLLQEAEGEEVVLTEAAMIPVFQNGGARMRYVEISAKDALTAVARCLASGGTDLALADANYVRDEESIYARPKG